MVRGVSAAAWKDTPVCRNLGPPHKPRLQTKRIGKCGRVKCKFSKKPEIATRVEDWRI